MSYAFEKDEEPRQTVAGQLEEDYLHKPVEIKTDATVQWKSEEYKTIPSINTLYVGIYGLSANQSSI